MPIKINKAFNITNRRRKPSTSVIPGMTVINYYDITSLAPRMMVVICERSPHSARNVREKALRKMGDNRGPKHCNLLLRGGVLVRACSASMEPVVN